MCKKCEFISGECSSQDDYRGKPGEITIKVAEGFFFKFFTRRFCKT